MSLGETAAAPTPAMLYPQPRRHGRRESFRGEPGRRRRAVNDGRATRATPRPDHGRGERRPADHRRLPAVPCSGSRIGAGRTRLEAPAWRNMSEQVRAGAQLADFAGSGKLHAPQPRFCADHGHGELSDGAASDRALGVGLPGSALLPAVDGPRTGNDRAAEAGRHRCRWCTRTSSWIHPDAEALQSTADPHAWPRSAAFDYRW